ncbi:PTS fructose transporter subunit IIC [Erysipelotrichaceae bacterium]|nr:PTS fructose transporter subunit IIC [Erysipelotrichaceae bacterium]
MGILKKNAVLLEMKATNKDEVFLEMLQYLEKEGLITDYKQCKQTVLKREDVLSTAMENGVAVPHASCGTVKDAFIAIGTTRKEIVWDDEQKKVDIFVFILTPIDGNGAHLKLLGEAAGKLVDVENIERIRQAKNIDEVLSVFEESNEVIATAGSKGLIIGVTGCPTGVAHTYMAAKALEKAAAEMGYEIKVETNGSIGVENSPTDAEIQQALAIIVAADKQVELNRFDGKKLINVGVNDGIDHPKKLITQSLTAPIFSGDGSAQPSNDGSNKSIGNEIYIALMNGVSYMIPFVIVGGLLIALSLAFGGVPTDGAGLVIPEGSAWNKILEVGVVAFTLMVPILAGFIAQAIGDRPALVAGMIGGWIANNGSFYDAESGMGFLGAILAGFLVGYIVKYLKKIKWPEIIKPIVPIMIIPLISTLIIAGLFIYVIGAPIASLMDALYAMLQGLSTGGIIVLGIVMGMMQGFDFGGPFGKVLLFFNIAMIAEGHPEFMGAQAVAIPVAPLGMAFAMWFDRKKEVFTTEEHNNATPAFAMSLVGISEGAIPFAAASPFSVLPASMAGSAVAAVLALTFMITTNVPHGGPIVTILGVVNKPIIALLCMIAGGAVTGLVATVLRKQLDKKRKKKINKK